jgi:fibronectin-binding autotransporter adhesin
VGSNGTINVNSGGVLSGGNGGNLYVTNTNSVVKFNGGTGSASLNLYVGNGGAVDLNGQSIATNTWGNLVADIPNGVLRNSSTNTATIASNNTIWVRNGTNLIVDASGGTIQIDSRITSLTATNAGIIKTGTNNLILTSTNNDYNGITTVSAGTLVVTNSTLTATILSNSVLVNFPSTPAAGTYNILSGPLASASLGSTTVTVAGQPLTSGLTATFINSPKLVLVVENAPSQTPQETYLVSFGLSGANLLGTADPDGDGMDNNAEFAFGTSPISGASRATTLTSGTGEIILTYLQRKTGVTYTVKSLPNLTTPFNSGTPVTPSLSNNQGNLPSDDYERYEAKLRTDSSRGFLQVKAVVP